MKAVLQRVTRASVRVGDEVVGEIGRGLCALVGVAQGDTESDADALVDKLVELRIFEDDAGKMNRSLVDVGGGLLAISQFTLLADVSRGRRPSFALAMAPDRARELFDHLCRRAASRVPVATGRFGADMLVSIENDGPVTICLDTRARAEPAAHGAKSPAQ